MELVLHLIKYSIYNWIICKDLKVIGLLLGLQIVYTKHQFFLCRWDSRGDKLHYVFEKIGTHLKFFFFYQDLSCFFVWSHQSDYANIN